MHYAAFQGAVAAGDIAGFRASDPDEAVDHKAWAARCRCALRLRRKRTPQEAYLDPGQHRDPAVAAAPFDLGSTGFLILPLPAALLVAATTLAARPGHLLPRWLARAGLPVAMVMVLGAFMFGPFMFALFALWLLAVAIALFRASPLKAAL